MTSIRAAKVLLVVPPAMGGLAGALATHGLAADAGGPVTVSSAAAVLGSWDGPPPSLGVMGIEGDRGLSDFLHVRGTWPRMPMVAVVPSPTHPMALAALKAGAQCVVPWPLAMSADWAAVAAYAWARARLIERLTQDDRADDTTGPGVAVPRSFAGKREAAFAVMDLVNDVLDASGREDWPLLGGVVDADVPRLVLGDEVLCHHALMLLLRWRATRGGGAPVTLRVRRELSHGTPRVRFDVVGGAAPRQAEGEGETSAMSLIDEAARLMGGKVGPAPAGGWGISFALREPPRGTWPETPKAPALRVLALGTRADTLTVVADQLKAGGMTVLTAMAGGDGDADALADPRHVDALVVEAVADTAAALAWLGRRGSSPTARRMPLVLLRRDGERPNVDWPGPTMTLRPPLKQEALLEALAYVAAPRAKDADDASAPHAVARVLLAERDPVARHVFALALRDAGATCTEVPDGEAALVAAAGMTFDIIILDGDEGDEGSPTVRALRRAGTRATLISALAPGAGARAPQRLREGFHDIVEKPYTAATARSVLSRWAPKPRRANPGATPQPAPHAPERSPVERMVMRPFPADAMRGMGFPSAPGGGEAAFAALAARLLHELRAALDARDEAGAKRAARELKAASSLRGDDKLATLCKALVQATDHGRSATALALMSQVAQEVGLAKDAWADKDRR